MDYKNVYKGEQVPILMVESDLGEALKARGFEEIQGVYGAVNSSKANHVMYQVPEYFMNKHLKPGEECVERLVLVFERVNAENGVYVVKGYVQE